MYDYVIEKPELNEETLAHYGVKGMKWKKRKHPKMEAREKRLKKAAADNLSFNKMKKESKYGSGEESGTFVHTPFGYARGTIGTGVRIDHKHHGRLRDAQYIRPTLNTTNVKKRKAKKNKQKSELWK